MSTSLLLLQRSLLACASSRRRHSWSSRPTFQSRWRSPCRAGRSLSTSSLDNRRPRGASRARLSPRGCPLLIVAFYASTSTATVATIAIVAIAIVLSSSYRRRCDPCCDCHVTVTPLFGVLAQRSLLARRSLRRFLDVVVVVVTAPGAFRRVPRRRSLVAAAVIETTIRPAPAASFGIHHDRSASLALGSRPAR